MKKRLTVPLFIAALFLIPSGAFAASGLEKSVGNTLVSVKAQGADTEWVSNAHLDDAAALADFVTTYNRIIARDNLTPEQVRKELSTAANQALGQQSSATNCLHEIGFAPVFGSDSPQLKMTIYPQTSYGYRLEVSFTPQQS